MSYLKVFRSSLLALVPVIFTLAIWILLRGDNLLRMFQKLENWLWVPSTPGEAIGSGYIIWFGFALLFSFVCGSIYYWVTLKWHWQAMQYALFLTLVATVVGLTAFFFKIEIAVESVGELLIIGIGFGVFIPWFTQKDLRSYY